jgi:hypothetical protein
VLKLLPHHEEQLWRMIEIRKLALNIRHKSAMSKKKPKAGKLTVSNQSMNLEKKNHHAALSIC